MRHFLLYSLIFCLLALAGCMARGGPSPAVPGGAPFTVQLPQRQSLAADQMPDHIKLVAAMLMDRMRGGGLPLPPGVDFAPGGANNIQEAGFNYRGFAFLGLDILDYAEKTTDNGGNVAMAGAFHFADGSGRLADAAFVAEYVMAGNTLTVLKADVRPTPSLFPQVVCFYVPMTAYAKAAGGLHSFESWLAFASKHAVKLSPTSADIARRAQWAALPAAEQAAFADKTWPMRPYAALVFLLGRVLPPGTVSMGFSTGPGSGLLYSDQADFINYNGWQIGKLEADLAIDHPENDASLRVNYTPDPDILPAGALRTYPIGIFSLQKDHAP